MYATQMQQATIAMEHGFKRLEGASVYMKRIDERFNSGHMEDEPLFLKGVGYHDVWYLEDALEADKAAEAWVDACMDRHLEYCALL